MVDPSTGETYAEAPLSGPGDVDLACQAAATAFDQLAGHHPVGAEPDAACKLADAIEARAEEFIAAEGRNTGKPLALTRSEEIPPMLDQIRFFAGAARVLEGRSAGEYMAGHTSWIRREPIGVVAQVTPWNYPMMMAVWKIAPALAAGNTVVLKPSDTTPVTHGDAGRGGGGDLPARRVQRRSAATGTRAGPWSATPSRSWSPSPGACGPAGRWPPRRPRTSSGCTWSWAAKPR